MSKLSGNDVDVNDVGVINVHVDDNEGDLEGKGTLLYFSTV